MIAAMRARVSCSVARLPMLVGLTCLMHLGLPVGIRAADRYEIPKLEGPVILDATLDELVWEQALTFELEYETRPAENVKPPVRTECKMFYSSSHLYYGCHAYDDPKQIRARLRDRDSASFSDDVVGLSLDPFNNKESSLVFDVNALGVQNDRRYTELSGRSDSSWDATWASSGRIVDDGFVVEVEIPFRALRFPRRDGVQVWGFNFRRYQPRDVSRRIAIHPNDRSNPCRICQSSELVGFEGIDPGRNLEITPTITGLSSRERARFPDGELDGDDPDVEAGITAKWGITPSLILGATVNPDFSQVEADEAQLDVNQQFALFFPELRPFFLEGADTFATHQNIIHTRAVADPSWGLKMTGREGRNALGVFVAEDEQTSFLFPGSEESSLGLANRSSTAAVLRYRRDFQRASSLGVVYTDRSGRDYSNRVGGFDGKWRMTDADSVEFQVLGSFTEYPEDIAREHAQGVEQLDGLSTFVRYGHQGRNWTSSVLYEDVGEDFRADLGFIPQVDFRRLSAETSYEWFGDADHWFTELEVSGFVMTSETRDGRSLLDRADLWMSYDGALLSNLSFGYQFVDVTIQGVELDDSRFWAEGRIQPSASLSLGLGLEAGRGVDFVEARQGDLVALNPSLRLELGRHVQARIDHTYRRLELPGSLRLFDAHLTELRFVYQINLRAFLRAIVQRTSVDRDPLLFTDPVDAEAEDVFGTAPVHLQDQSTDGPLSRLYRRLPRSRPLRPDRDWKHRVLQGGLRLGHVNRVLARSRVLKRECHCPAPVFCAAGEGLKRSNHSMMRGVTSISRRGSRGPWGVRG